MTDDLDPMECGERVASAFMLDGMVYAMTETGVLWRQQFGKWTRHSEIPRLSPEEAHARKSELDETRKIEEGSNS